MVGSGFKLQFKLSCINPIFTCNLSMEVLSETSLAFRNLLLHILIWLESWEERVETLWCNSFICLDNDENK